ncbi:hypothetical protein H7198_06235 [Fructobacillus sp. CRL 2054]|uniref:phage holin, LLH family n=1 Tax=Fructobacillus sp. CRL 2054 TaxID=2763007 RepID=UPI0023796CBF|nr:phage holin, LLH family [Fructobacillus sp. CRL 2054]MDD9139200.1 hypothetical protein [Fructobacillus sp. CRL 2054]
MDITQAQAMLTMAGTAVVLLAKPLYSLDRYIKAHTRNAHIKSACDWAEQAVTYVVNSGVGTDQHKAQAVAFLTARIKSNGLAKNFTDEQIEFYVDQALDELDKTAGNVQATSLPTK